MRQISLALVVLALLSAIGLAQDSPSLGDVARQARIQKQQKEAQAKDSGAKDSLANTASNADQNSRQPTAPRTAHVITNEELPEHTAPYAASAHHPKADGDNAATNLSPADKEAQGEHWKSQIQMQKSNVAALQKEVDDLSSSIHYAGGNCVANCAQWNERQQQKQQQLDSMKGQLEEQQHQLEDMQESARREGFGSSVYDP